MCWGLPTGSPAWRALDPYARDAYCWIERRFRRTNNGKIPMSARDLADDMGVNKDTAQKALVRLRVFGFIVPTEKGRMAGPYGERRATRWRLTEYGMDGSLPTRDYLDIHIDKARSRCNRLFERPTSSDATSHHVGRMRPTTSDNGESENGYFTQSASHVVGQYAGCPRGDELSDADARYARFKAGNTRIRHRHSRKKPGAPKNGPPERPGRP